MQVANVYVYVYMPIIFFAYGMSFLILGIAAAVEYLQLFHTHQKDKTSYFVFTPIAFLAIFGLIHGLVEFMGMFSILSAGKPSIPFRIIKMVLLAISFYWLSRFGVSYDSEVMNRADAAPPGDKKVSYLLNLPWVSLGSWFILILLLYVRTGLSDKYFMNGDALARYLVGLPATVVASVKFFKAYKGRISLSEDVYRILAAVAFLLYGIFAGVIGPKAGFYPASVLNYISFYSFTHVPVQIFRTLCAIAITITLLKFYRQYKGFLPIRLKAILHIFIAVIVPSFAILIIVSYMIANSLIKLSYKENDKLALLAAEKVYLFFDNIEANVKYYVLFSRTTSPDIEKKLLVSLVRDNDDISGLILFTGGDELLHVAKDAHSGAVNYIKDADDAHIRKFLSPPVSDMLFTGFSIERDTDTQVSMKILFNKRKIDILIPVSKLYDTVSDLPIKRGQYIRFQDDKGSTVRPVGNNDNGEATAPTSTTLYPGRYYKELHEDNGVYYLPISEDIEPIGWKIILGIPRNEIVAPIFGIFKSILLWIVVICLTTVGVAIIFVNKVTGGISLIAQKVRLIAHGDFNQRFGLETDDELQDLSEEIEKMEQSLLEKKKMEDKMVHTEKIASLGHLTAGIAHEINNPLGIILGYCQMMLRRIGPDSGSYEDLKVIEKHVLTCKKILQDLLNFSRPYRKAESEVKIPVNINVNIKEALLLIPDYFLQEKVNVQLDLSPALPEIVGNPDRLHQVFLNLTINAIDAMKETGGNLVISTTTRDSNGKQTVEIIFSDTGCGIKEEDKGKIFDPFFTTKEVGKGTGLGLSVSYGIVKEHSGEIWAESAWGKGSTFHITFPSREGSS